MATLLVCLAGPEIPWIVLSVLLGTSQAGAASHLFVLAGQSNMAGLGVVSEADFPDSIPQVRVWNGFGELSGGWGPLRPGLAFKKENFGPEMTFGELLSARSPSDTFYLIKVAVGGTMLADEWRPPSAGGPGYWYSAMLENVSSALDSLVSRPPLEGVIWMQGESDAIHDSTARAYSANLRAFVADVRKAWNAPAVPWYIGLIDTQPSWPYAATVRAAQADVAQYLSCIVSVETIGLQTDGVHYGTEGQKQLGRLFAEAWMARTSSVERGDKIRLISRFGDITLVGLNVPLAKARWVDWNGATTEWFKIGEGMIPIHRSGRTRCLQIAIPGERTYVMKVPPL